ncbi:hypothetical protein [Mycolicibacterium sp. OfavD-34-C]|uniref:hypothetical protein n=1 Tax=Mycolicibacterium sp. OfavD-34-C TaxID=2917746 RepID=UPI001EF6457B|nr:hypothetical protein [Mycolicibacterium sp. OfavD-34-C]MCG7579386.1 hypothetical protein [Mycolicibacterium sp. OfavD-34-C]
MVRNLGRIGGAAAGIIAIVFGVLDLMNLTPPPWLPIGLGATAVGGVVADYFVERRSSRDEKPPNRILSQKGGKGSNNAQAGRDMKGVHFGSGDATPKKDKQ